VADGLRPRGHGPDAPLPDPPPDPNLDLTATFYGLGDAPLGGTIEEAEAALGVDFGEVEPLNDSGDCGLAQAESSGLGVLVASPGGEQAFVVTAPEVPFVMGTATPVGVGSTADDVRAAFPRWAGSEAARMGRAALRRASLHADAARRPFRRRRGAAAGGRRPPVVLHRAKRLRSVQHGAVELDRGVSSGALARRCGRSARWALVVGQRDQHRRSMGRS
jgi:hypothetical protein